jgi:hypothetical protein
MSQLEYLVALLSIIVGLALTDLARSLRELVRPDRTVRWHWLHLAWSASVFLILVWLWWNSFTILKSAAFSEALAFVPYLGQFLLLYLTCSLALPSPDREKGITGGEEDVLDLEAFYFLTSRRRWFFGALAATSGTIGLLSAGVFLYYGAPSLISLATGVGKTLAVNFTPAVLAAGLAVTDRWWLHAVGGALTPVVMAASMAAYLPPLGSGL